jgi:hypothetical protein
MTLDSSPLAPKVGGGLAFGPPGTGHSPRPQDLARHIAPSPPMLAGTGLQVESLVRREGDRFRASAMPRSHSGGYASSFDR